MRNEGGGYGQNLSRLSALSLPGSAASAEPSFAAALVIDNAYAKLYEKYYGVKLLSKSLLADADPIHFTMRNTKGETVEMRRRQRGNVGAPTW
ncbi:MAG TPA: hypothetical protein PK961_01965 [bacterium]|nr:hypothetical protein [bacterium]